MQSNGYTCCGYDDVTLRWYINQEHGYSICAHSPEEAENIAMQGIARDLGRLKTLGNIYNQATKARLARALRAGRIEMTEVCLKDVKRYDEET